MNSILILVAFVAFVIFLLRKRLHYWITYFLCHHFTGSHQKPESDSKFDPKLAHISHPIYKHLRNLEETYYSGLPTNPQENLPLPSVDAEKITPELFMKLTENKTKPLVIRGLIKNSEAVKNWGPNFFSENYGKTELLTLKIPENFSNAYNSFNDALDFHKIPLGESIKRMQSEEETLYLNNITQIFASHPELADHLELNHLQRLDNYLDANHWLKINLFMGGPDTGSSLHCAVGGNFFFNVYGQKRWILIDPNYSKYLRSTPSKRFAFVISEYDIENPSDILNRIPKYEVVLEPGDVLFNPPWWWHYVKNVTDFTIGCAIRDHNVYWQSWKNNPMYMAFSPYTYSLNPWILWLLEKVKGRDYLRKLGLSSDKYIVNYLTDSPIED